MVETITLVSAISLSNERVLEIIKRLVPSLGGLKDDTRVAVLYGASTLIGAVTAYASGIDAIPKALFIGLLSSGGAGMWHDMLSILTEIKNFTQRNGGVQ